MKVWGGIREQEGKKEQVEGGRKKENNIEKSELPFVLIMKKS